MSLLLKWEAYRELLYAICVIRWDRQTTTTMLNVSFFVCCIIYCMSGTAGYIRIGCDYCFFFVDDTQNTTVKKFKLLKQLMFTGQEVFVLS